MILKKKDKVEDVVLRTGLRYIPLKFKYNVKKLARELVYEQMTVKKQNEEITYLKNRVKELEAQLLSIDRRDNVNE